ncbi:DUF992 domain-containing protein [Bosea sp. (in: a-proteobacteria)]|uniref:DUF992 domain-containing protein n=1 Tax=Bosea sp. (in: a-proteobacteria) TaxID=1871050 RepID=UPI00263991BA|nr:DUF992 domain-containing protein [Bosea sp. (in: a-proteobacteria)]MCO5090326.1 DUF992 domain-containing protein [Bosea sp. (in: a-proteobacteria)]
MSRKASRFCLAVLALAGLIGMHEPAAAQAAGPPAGRLSCTVGTGFAAITRAQRPTECRFRPRRGPLQHYTGVVRGFSLDLGAVRTASMVWRVYGPYARAPLGALSGQYRSGNANAPSTAGNALSGVRGNKVTLLPLPLQGSGNINVAFGVTALDLDLVPPGRRR